MYLAAQLRPRCLARNHYLLIFKCVYYITWHGESQKKPLSCSGSGLICDFMLRSES